VTGRYGAGSVLPVEADLGQKLGVGRSSIREALRVLVDKGMIEVKTRTGARVTDRDQWRRLDPDVIRWTLANGPDALFLKDLVEARRIVEPEAAALAAKRATAQDLAELEAALNEMAVGLREDISAYVSADVRFHFAILAAAHNTVLREFEIIIEAALDVAFRISTSQSRSPESAIDTHRDLFIAIRHQDPTKARERMVNILDLAVDDLRL
jgi:GntR family galactonate operon transcriptional repressor